MVTVPSSVDLSGVTPASSVRAGQTGALGAALLVRQRGPVVPTGVGATLIDRARRRLRLLAALIENEQRTGQAIRNLRRALTKLG